MQKHYIRLLTDIELNDHQKNIWYRVVEKFLESTDINDTDTESFISDLTSTRAEHEGDDEFPYVYIVYLSDLISMPIAEQIVDLWSDVYPKDFEIETSADVEDCDDCDIEIDDMMYEEIKRRASKFMHNRWVDDRVAEGWRYGNKINETDMTHPSLLNWDSLNEQYRKELELTREQAATFFKKYPYIFV